MQTEITQASPALKKHQKPVSVKLNPALKSRLEAIAVKLDKTPHSIMQSAISAFVEKEEEKAFLLQEAIEAFNDYELTGLHVSEEKANEWLRKMAAGIKAVRPEWQK